MGPRTAGAALFGWGQNPRRWLSAAAIALFVPTLAHAQRLTGTVVESDGRTPAPFIALLMLDATGNAVARTQSTSSGSFSIDLPSAGTYTVRALRVGFKPTTSERVVVAVGDAASLRLQLTSERIVLAAVQVRERATCGSMAAKTALIETWDQARAALLGVARTGPSDVKFETLTWTLEQDVWPDTATRISTEASGRSDGAAYRSPPAQELLRNGFVRALGDSLEFHAPDAFVLLDPAFAESYCFLLEPAPAGHPDWVGLGVTPAQLRAGNVAIDGVLWLTRDGALQRFEYKYLGIDHRLDAAQAGGRVDFLELPTGEWIVSRWSIRMPQGVTHRTPQGLNAREDVTVRLGRIVERGAAVTRVQLSDGQFLTPGQLAVSLTLRSRDGLPQPLAGTLVSLPAEANRWESDASGVVDVGLLSPGEHRFSVKTALMRDVGIPAEPIDLLVLPDTIGLRATLPVPSVGDVRKRLCPKSPNEAVAVGVHPALAMPGSAYVMQAGESSGRRFAVTTDTTGKWHACALPRRTSLVLVGERGGVSETLARFRIPRNVDLAFVGTLGGQALSTAATLPIALSDSATARITVRVFAARDSSVLRDAEAVIDDSLLVKPNARGDLRISELDSGTHSLTVRRLGYMPVGLSIDLARKEARVDTVFLERLPPLLAEVKVRGRMVRVPVKFVDVLRRAASGWGTVFTREDIKRAAEVKSLLATLPGTITEDHTVAFQSCAISLDPNAAPKVQVYVDGVRVTMVPQYSGNGRGVGGPDEINLILKTVNMADIEFIEVYRGPAEIPADFVNDACAVIAIWTKAY